MLCSLTFLLTIANIVTAQSRNQSVNLYIPGDNRNNALAASVISADSGAAVYAVGCASGSVQASTSASLMKRQQSQSTQPRRASTTSAQPGSRGNGYECGFPTPITITQGPATLKFAYALEAASLAVDCKLTSSDKKLFEAVCTGSQSGIGTQAAGVQTATLNGTDLMSAVAVKVTAGAEKLTALVTTANSTTTTSQSSTTTSKSGSGTITPPPTSGSATTSASATPTSGARAVSVPATLKISMIVVGIGMALFLS